MFPVADQGGDELKASIAPVGCYRPNARSLYDMVGNVWEAMAALCAPKP